VRLNNSPPPRHWCAPAAPPPCFGKENGTRTQISKRKTPYIYPTLRAQFKDPDAAATTSTAQEITGVIRRDSDRLEREERLTAMRRANLTRATCGQHIIDYYGRLPGMDPDPSTVLTDLLTDLMHAATSNHKLHWQRSLDSAEAHWYASAAACIDKQEKSRWSATLKPPAADNAELCNRPVEDRGKLLSMI
jgi:hypothetical protein